MHFFPEEAFKTNKRNIKSRYFNNIKILFIKKIVFFHKEIVIMYNIAEIKNESKKHPESPKKHSFK